MALSFVGMKTPPSKKIGTVIVKTSEFAKSLTKSVFDETAAMEKKFLFIKHI